MIPIKKLLCILILALAILGMAPAVAAGGLTGETAMAVELAPGQTGRVVLTNTLGYEVAGFQFLFTVENERLLVRGGMLATVFDISATRRLLADIDLTIGSRVQLFAGKPIFYGMVIWPW